MIPYPGGARHHHTLRSHITRSRFMNVFDPVGICKSCAHTKPSQPEYLTMAFEIAALIWTRWTTGNPLCLLHA